MTLENIASNTKEELYPSVIQLHYESVRLGIHTKHRFSYFYLLFGVVLDEATTKKYKNWRCTVLSQRATTKPCRKNTIWMNPPEQESKAANQQQKQQQLCNDNGVCVCQVPSTRTSDNTAVDGKKILVTVSFRIKWIVLQTPFSDRNLFNHHVGSFASFTSFAHRGCFWLVLLPTQNTHNTDEYRRPQK